MRVAALVVAAGRGDRLGHELPKAFVPLAGRPMLLHALAAMAAADDIDCVVPVVAERDLGRLRAGVESLPSGVELVAVHDAARPLVSADAVARVVAAASRSGAAILAVPVRDTIKRVREGRVAETPPRAECFAAQTPQVFRTEILREALAKAAAEGCQGTDDAQLVEALGVAVQVVAGDPFNLKVTHPEDVAAAERLLAETRVRR
jgi:2-C-methyl-D-erythritol 4-phosphate cytidylyltransferase